MAQSRIGGTKSFIHGKVGSEVYYTDKNLDGDIIQVVKAVPDYVRNPRTDAQKKGRIIMATLYKAVGVLAPLINHSFVDIAEGRPSLCHFYSANYQLIKQDIQDNPSTDYQFPLVSWKGTAARPGAYLIAEGTIKKGSQPTIYQATSQTYCRIRYRASKSKTKISNMKSYFDMENGDFLTLVQITANGICQMAKLTWNYDGDESLDVDETTFFEVFDIEGDMEITFSRGSSTSYFDAYLGPRCTGGCQGIILTKFIDGVAQHSTARMVRSKNQPSSYEEALASYPDGDRYYY